MAPKNIEIIENSVTLFLSLENIISFEHVKNFLNFNQKNLAQLKKGLPSLVYTI
jgi:hypothetical protein